MLNHKISIMLDFMVVNFMGHGEFHGDSTPQVAQHWRYPPKFHMWLAGKSSIYS
jgi:hypothetical protein